MSIFNLHDDIIQDYRNYVHSFLTFEDQRIGEFVNEELDTKNSLWPDALIQVNPSYETVDTIEGRVKTGLLSPGIADIFRDGEGRSLRLYRHQLAAIEEAVAGRPFVVTSGTGSGKSLTYLIPIFNSVLQKGTAESRVRAIIIYPMNALVNSQYEALTRFAEQYEERFHKPCPVTFRKYTGQESDEEKQAIQTDPPHILLTNYMMLELMLVRPEEHRFVDRATAGIEFLVLDELHTYRGRQGADVALLIRRLRNRCGNPDLLCIGTSATMVAGKEMTAEERRATVGSFATTLFGVEIGPGQVIEESLLRTTTYGGELTGEVLAEALAGPTPVTEAELVGNPLVAWMETTFGISSDSVGVYRRNVPISLTEGSERLAALTGADPGHCRTRLNEVFIAGSELLTARGSPLFGFKLHQFISQGRTLFATIEPHDQRYLTLEGQYYTPGRTDDAVLFPLKFCRVCGQEYYSVVRDQEGHRLSPAEEFVQLDELEAHGYVMLARDFDGEVWTNDALPAEWFDKAGRLKKDRQPNRPHPIWIRPDGTYVEAEGTLVEPDGVRAWFQPRPFLLCQNCGEFYQRTSSRSDFRKLSGLATEGRSTSTTVLTLTAYEKAPLAGIEKGAQKVLSFTDNRQDASLQAGHFNDFAQVSFLRGAIYRALLAAPDGLTYDTIARAAMDAMDLTLADVAENEHLSPTSPKATAVWQAFQSLVEYRLYEDLQRGWRVVQPNLEQCGLLRFEYLGLAALCNDEARWRDVPHLSGNSPEQRERVLTNLLDFFRRNLIVRTESFDIDVQYTALKQWSEQLAPRWTPDVRDVQYLTKTQYAVRPGQTRPQEFRSLEKRSLFGQYLSRQIEGLQADEYAPLMNRLIDMLITEGILHRRLVEGTEAVRLESSSMKWRVAEGEPMRDPIYSRRLQGGRFDDTETWRQNKYFTEFYRTIAPTLKRVEGREHTAQVKNENRVERERRFREGSLACLFCSPTMELGIDIADLRLVHMRNVPPTPANYAQRSGRAGRQGDPALVMTYCSALSGHDQYFFSHPEALVAGSVAPPRIDLGNEDLVRAHVHAVWLSFAGLGLGRSIDELLDFSDPTLSDLPLMETVQAQIRLKPEALKRCIDAARQILASAGNEMTTNGWYTDTWLQREVTEAAGAFDRAFDRWRDLYRAADKQYNDANVFLGRPCHDKYVKKQHERLRDEASRQKDLLCNASGTRGESDFYPYRYLASEGFLPGYNFPRIPLRAFLQAGTEGEYVSRPRMLALTEFGPGSIIYHEGKKFKVTRLTPPAGGFQSLQRQAKCCHTCGYFNEETVDVCSQCETALDGGNSELLLLMEMTNVSARRKERITSDEEERTRRGFEITTHFAFFTDGTGARRVLSATAEADGSPLLRLEYGPSAKLYRVNHGWRNQRERTFYLDTGTGTFVGDTSDDEDEAPSSAKTIEPVKLFVSETENLLRVTYLGDPSAWTEDLQTSLQYALQRGIEQVFQLDEREVDSDRMGTGEHAALLFWEASEGGAGVLKRLVLDAKALSQVAAAALERCHFDPEGRDTAADRCARACYECLLSYSNQRDYRRLNRHDIRVMLQRLVGTTTLASAGPRTYHEQYAWLVERSDPASELERRFLAHLYTTHRRLPDEAGWHPPDAFIEADFHYAPNVCVFIDGSVHDPASVREKDRERRRELSDLGYRVIAIRYDEDLEAQVGRHTDIFGKGAA